MKWKRTGTPSNFTDPTEPAIAGVSARFGCWCAGVTVCCRANGVPLSRHPAECDIVGPVGRTLVPEGPDNYATPNQKNTRHLKSVTHQPSDTVAAQDSGMKTAPPHARSKQCEQAAPPEPEGAVMCRLGSLTRGMPARPYLAKNSSESVSQHM